MSQTPDHPSRLEGAEAVAPVSLLPDGEQHRNFYGRRHGKTLRPNQIQHLAEDLPRLSLKGVERSENPARDKLDLAARFGSLPVWLEVGFGGGEHLDHMARQNPKIGFIGCEAFINGTAMLLNKLHGNDPGNIALHPGDVRDLLDVLPDQSLGRCYLLYPDPWHKARHHRRRFVTPEHLLPLAQVLQPGAELRLATDIPDYVRQALEEVPPAGFELVYHSGTPWEGWFSTRYEKKALREGRVPDYLIFRRQG